jgi:hypothetical protein
VALLCDDDRGSTNPAASWRYDDATTSVTGRSDVTERKTEREPPFEYRLERLAVGVAVLDAGGRVTSANAVAERALAVRSGEVFGRDLLDLHPPAARERIRRLIADARGADGEASTLVATPMGNFLAKASRLASADPAAGGVALLFVPLGFTLPSPETRPEPAGTPLAKLPVERGAKGRIALVDVDRVFVLSARGHYAEALTDEGRLFCPRSLADLEARLDPARFFRVHRGHLVNLAHVRAVERVDGRWMLTLDDAARTSVPVGRRIVADVRARLAV